MNAWMKKFLFAILFAMVLLFAFPVFSNGLSAKEKRVVPDPVRDDSVSVLGGTEKIKSESGFFEIKLLAPVDTSVSERVEFGWDVYQTQALPGDPMTYIFLNGRKFAMLRGLANNFTANLQPGQYRWQVLIGLAWNGGSHLDTSTEENFEVESGTATFMQNFPNPFNPITTIRYSLVSDSNVRLAVYDMLGREVIVLADGFQPAGEYQAKWNAGHLPSGNYFCRLEINGTVTLKKMTLLK